MSLSNAVETQQDHAETKAARKPNSALMKSLQPSSELAAVVGSAPLPRTEVVSKVWEYIKANNPQNPKSKREILRMTSSRMSSAARAR